MKIAIIGAGNVGTTLGRAWLKRGHEIAFGVRNPDEAKAKNLAKQLPSAKVMANAQAAGGAELIVLATPWNGAEQAVRSCGDLAGKIIIDCTNPLNADASGLALGHTTSGAEQISAWAGGAQVFKTMNQVGFMLMDQPRFPGGVRPVMFVCGDGEGRTMVLKLVAELGFDAIDAGGLKIARLLEPMAMLWIHLALTGKVPGEFAFALLRK